MNNFYNITKGQLKTIWVFLIIFWFFSIGAAVGASDVGGTFELWHILGIVGAPFFLIFYSIGWKNNQEKVAKD